MLFENHFSYFKTNELQNYYAQTEESRTFCRKSRIIIFIGKEAISWPLSHQANSWTNSPCTPTGNREAPCSNVFRFCQRFSKRTISCKKTESARNIKTLPLRFAANNAWGVFHEKSRHFRDGGLCYTMQKLLHFASELTFYARRDFLRAALFLW